MRSSTNDCIAPPGIAGAGEAIHLTQDAKETKMSRPIVLSASSVTGDSVVDAQGENLGKIEEVMLDVDDERIAYAVLSFGGFLGIGDKLFAVPWGALKLDAQKQCFVLNESKERLKNAPGFEKDSWPNMADRSFGSSVYDYYGTAKYW
jgi:sporulation protein YlmC with PRC-barrel domain